MACTMMRTGWVLARAMNEEAPRSRVPPTCALATGKLVSMGEEELSRKWSCIVIRSALLAHMILIAWCTAKDQAYHEEMLK